MDAQTRTIQLPRHGPLLVHVLPPSSEFERWTVNLLSDDRDSWIVTTAEGATEDEAIASLLVAMRHYGRHDDPPTSTP